VLGIYATGASVINTLHTSFYLFEWRYIWVQVENWGLWWLPSFINHSCMPNSSQILVGRALFVFASRELQAGEEITRGYFDIFQPHQQRKDLSTKGWGFVCHCPRCKLEDALHTPLSQVTNHYTKLVSAFLFLNLGVYTSWLVVFLLLHVHCDYLNYYI
jgi:hypothetical protein